MMKRKQFREEPISLLIKDVSNKNHPLLDKMNQTFRESSESMWLKKAPSLFENEKGTTDELAYTALELRVDNFFEQLKVIKDHLNSKSHPITRFMKVFGSEFWEYYKDNLCSNSFDHQSKEKEEKNIDDITRTALDWLLFIMFSVFISIIKFYNLKICSNEMWRDLLLNIVASLTLK